jgi:hypothetical protein
LRQVSTFKVNETDPALHRAAPVSSGQAYATHAKKNTAGTLYVRTPASPSTQRPKPVEVGNHNGHTANSNGQDFEEF